MDAGPVTGTVSAATGLVATPHFRAQWLSLRRLRTGDTLRTFANGLVAQRPVDPLGLGVGIPSLLVGRADHWQEARAP